MDLIAYFSQDPDVICHTLILGGFILGCVCGVFLFCLGFVIDYVTLKLQKKGKEVGKNDS